MNLLLDIHTFLWMTDEVKRLSPLAREMLSDKENQLYMSSISAWEIAQKFRFRKLPLPSEPAHFISYACHEHEIDMLPFETEASGFLQQLPLLHRDPFDRMLICQAIQHGLAIVTNDRFIAQYPIRTIW